MRQCHAYAPHFFLCGQVSSRWLLPFLFFRRNKTVLLAAVPPAAKPNANSSPSPPREAQHHQQPHFHSYIFTGTKGDAHQWEERLAEVRQDPTNPFAYAALGDALSSSPTIELPGRFVLKKRDEVTLPDGRVLSKRDFYVESVRCDFGKLGADSCAELYLKIGALLHPGEKIQLHCGSPVAFSARQILLQALAIASPTNKQLRAKTLHCLGMAVEGAAVLDPLLFLSNKRSVTRTALFLEAIDCDPTYSPALSALADTLPPASSIKLPDGFTYTSDDLRVKALCHSPANVDAMLGLAGAEFKAAGFPFASFRCGKLITRLSRRLVTFEPAKVFVEAQRCSPTTPSIYMHLASTLTPACPTVQLADGRLCSKIDLYRESLRCDPRQVSVLLGMAAMLGPTDLVALSDEVVLNKFQLSEYALELNPRSVEALAGSSLNLATVAHILDETPGPRHFDAGIVEAYLLLGHHADDSKSYLLPNGRCLTRKELLVEAVTLAPTMAETYLELANCLGPSETVKLPENRPMGYCKPAVGHKNPASNPGALTITYSAQHLFVQALRLCPHLAEAYLGLFWIALDTTGKARPATHLADGRVLSAEQLLREAVRCDANNPEVALALALVQPPAQILLRNGRFLSQLELLLEAQRCSSKPLLITSVQQVCLQRLRQLVSRGGTVTLLDGRVLDRHGLMLEQLFCTMHVRLEQLIQAFGLTLDISEALMMLFYSRSTPGGEAGEKGALAQTPAARKELLVKTLRRNSEDAEAYLLLAMHHRLAPAGKTVALPDGRELSMLELLVEAQRFSRSIVQDKIQTASLVLLRAWLPPGDTVMLANRRVRGRFGLLVEQWCWLLSRPLRRLHWAIAPLLRDRLRAKLKWWRL